VANYLQRVIRDGTIEVSPIELFQDNGRIASPNVPVIRVSTPVFAPDCTPFGIIVINVDLRPAFARIRAAGHPPRLALAPDQEQMDLPQHRGTPADLG